MKNRNTSSNSNFVTIRSVQTPREQGEIMRVENDYIHGDQFLVKTYSREWGVEFFWMRKEELAFNE